jgi:hypothetical protein
MPNDNQRVTETASLCGGVYVRVGCDCCGCDCCDCCGGNCYKRECVVIDEVHQAFVNEAQHAAREVLGDVISFTLSSFNGVLAP